MMLPKIVRIFEVNFDLFHPINALELLNFSYKPSDLDKISPSWANAIQILQTYQFPRRENPAVQDVRFLRVPEKVREDAYKMHGRKAIDYSFFTS